MRPQSDIDKQLNIAANLEEDGKNPFFGLTYAQGVEAGIRWVLGETEELPLDPAEIEGRE